MENETFIRCAALYGEENFNKLKSKRVAVFGLGGVGSFAAESLIRSGIGTLDVFDGDTVKPSNINRQLVADLSTVNMLKTDAFVKRASLIDKNAVINTYSVFYLPENADKFDLSVYDFIIDAVDTVKAKVHLIVTANKLNIPLISVMGTGNKTHPENLKISDIYKTEYCPLAKAVRLSLKKYGIKKQTVVWSDEQPLKSKNLPSESTSESKFIASSVFVPASAGLLAASFVVNRLTEN